MDELIVISALVGDRNYRVKIKPADEEVVRKTLKSINEKILDFKTRFAGRDMQDYISMVLLWFATEQNTGMAAGIEKENIAAELSALERMIDKHLQS